MTNALCSGRGREVDAWNYVVDLAIARKVPLVPVILSANVVENVRRLQSSERECRKMTDSENLPSALLSDRIQVPSVRETTLRDVTLKSPDEAAEDVIRHVHRLGAAGWLAPATDAHR